MQRHGISRLPQIDGDKPDKRKFKPYPIGYFHIDIAEVHTEEGRLYLLVAIDRTSKFAYVELHEKATTRVAADFLRALIKAVPYKVHTVLTDNGTHFTTPGNKGSTVPNIKLALETGEPFRAHAFEFACAQNDIAPSRKRRSAATTTKPMSSCAATSPTSSRATTLLVG